MDSHLLLFGKHPAWSDHMVLVEPEDKEGKLLKRYFYDYSVVPGSDVDPILYSGKRFLLSMVKTTFLVVGVPSRDKLGRSRFPLFAAYPVSRKRLDKLDPNYLELLSCEMTKFLLEVAGPDNVDVGGLDANDVEKSRQKFRVGSRLEAEMQHKVPASKAICLLNGLAEGCRAFAFNQETPEEMLALAEAAGSQFLNCPYILLLIGDDELGSALMIKFQGEGGFSLDEYFGKTLPALTDYRNKLVKATERVIGGLVGKEEVLAVEEMPSLRLKGRRYIQKLNASRRKPQLIFLSALFCMGLFYVFLEKVGENRSASAQILDDNITQEGLEKVRREWAAVALEYITWVGPVLEWFYAGHHNVLYERFNEFKVLEFNPFLIGGGGEIREDLLKNPSNRIFLPENQERLKIIEQNLEDLKLAIVDFYDEINPSVTIEKLKREGFYWPENTGQVTDQVTFDVELVEVLKRRLAEHQLVNDFYQEYSAFDEGVLAHLEAGANEFYDELVSLIKDSLKAGEIDKLLGPSGVFYAIGQAYAELTIQVGEIDFDRLYEDPRWVDESAGGLDIQGALDRIEMLDLYSLVNIDKVTALIEDLSLDYGGVKGRLSEAKKLFPKHSVLEDERLLRLEEIRMEIDSFKNLITLKIDYEKAEKVAGSIRSELGVILGEIALVEERLSSPDLWLDYFEEELNVLDVDLRNLCSAALESARSGLIADLKGSSSVAFKDFQDDAEEIFNSIGEFKNFLDNPPRQLSSYFAKEEQANHARTIILERLKGGISVSGTDFPELWNETIQGAIEGIFSFLVKEQTALAMYDKREGEALLGELRSQFRNLVVESFALPGKYREKIQALSSADGSMPDSVNEEPALYHVNDLYWALVSGVSQGGITLTGLEEAVIMHQKLAERPEGDLNLKKVWYAAYLQVLETLIADTPRLAKAIMAKDLYLPKYIQDEGLILLHEISGFYLDVLDHEEGQGYSTEVLQGLAQRTENGTLKELLGFGIMLRQKSGDVSFKDGLESFSNSVDVIKEITLLEEEKGMEFVLIDNVGVLRFLPVKTKNNTVFVQDRPMTVGEFFRIAHSVGLDLEDFRFYAQNCYPRNFEFGGANGFVPFESLRFLDEGSFTPYSDVSVENLPMHILQPTLAAKLAESIGMRLLKIEEVAAMRDSVEDSDVAARTMKFSEEVLASLETSKAANYSVFKNAIIDRDFFADGVGGVNFDTTISDQLKFRDTNGGVAELCLEGEEFYFFGPTWLHGRNAMKEPILIKDAEEVYIDLGIRLAFDPPVKSFREMYTEKIADSLTAKFFELKNGF